MRRPAVIATGTFTLALLAYVIALGIPFLTKKRETAAAITSPPALLRVDLVVVPPHGRLCMDNITADAHSQIARFRVGTYGKPGPALAMQMRGDGYRVTKTIASGWPDNAIQSLPVAPPRRATLLRVCIRNEGSTKIAFYAANDSRANSRAAVSVNGRRVAPTPWFGFWEARRHSIGERAALTVHRIAVFRGPLGYTAVAWIALVAALLGLTLGLGLVLWFAFAATAPERGSTSVSARPTRARPLRRRRDPTAHP